MWDWLEKLKELIGQKCALVTLISCRGSTPREIGAKMVVLPDGKFFGTIGGGLLEQIVLEETVKVLADGESKSLHLDLCPRTGQCCGGDVEVFVDIQRVRPKLYLFGAGHVGKALSKTLEGTPFEVHVIDERPEWIDAKDLPRSATLHKMAWPEFMQKAPWESQRTYVAIMTHSHEMDQDIIEAVSKQPNKYVGLIGSDTKWRRFRHRLLEKGMTEEQLNRVNCPIGLPIGGKAPQEVAISVASQLLKLHNEAAQ